MIRFNRLPKMQRAGLRLLATQGSLTVAEAADILQTTHAGAIRAMDGLVAKGLCDRQDAPAPGVYTATLLRAWRANERGTRLVEDLVA